MSASRGCLGYLEWIGRVRGSVTQYQPLYNSRESPGARNGTGAFDIRPVGRLLPVDNAYRESFAELVRAHNRL